MNIDILVKRVNCKKTEVISENNGVFYMNVKGEVKEGKANLEIVKFFNKKYKKPVRIIKGLKSKRKVIEIE